MIGKKLKILILGGSGFIGSAVIPELLSRGHQVITTFCHEQPAYEDSSGITWIAWDGTKQCLPEIEWREIDAALHLANDSDMRDFPTKAGSIYQVLVESVLNLLQKAYINGISRVVLVSTGDVLSENIQIASEEDRNYDPKSFYGTAKACAELIANSYWGPISTAVLRLFHPYGTGGERFLINRLIMSVKEGKEVPIEGRDGIIISPIHINDVARGIAIALESKAQGIFHLSGPNIMSLRSLLELLGKLIGREPIIKCLPKRPAGGHAAFHTHTKEILGYVPSISIETGIRALLGLA